MSALKTNALLDLWASSFYFHEASPPFAGHHYMLKIIGSSTIRDVQWQCFSIQYTGEILEIDLLPWMTQEYDVWFWDPHLIAYKILSNPSFVSKIDLFPFGEYSTNDPDQQYKDFMSGEWAWE